MTNEQRLEALEIKLAHLERASQELSDVLIAQQRQLDQLLTRLQQVADRVETLGDGGGPAGTPVEIPPHY